MIKVCTKCRKTFPPSSFHRDSRARGGRRSCCSFCVARINKENTKRIPVLSPEETHKNCPRCERLGRDSLLPVEDFGTARRMLDGKNSWCRECCSEATGDWQRTDSGREKHAEAVKRYRERQKRASYGVAS